MSETVKLTTFQETMLRAIQAGGCFRDSHLASMCGEDWTPSRVLRIGRGLERLGLAQFSFPIYWGITDAGRAALQSTQEKTDGK